MDITGLFIFLGIGALAGFLAGKIMTGGGYGLIGDIIVGIVGGVVGGYVFPLLGIAIGGILGQVITATVGAIILIFLIRLVKRI